MENIVKFQQIVEAFWKYRLSDNPLLATRTGDHRFNDKLPNVELPEYDSRFDKYSKLMNDLNTIDPMDFDDADKLNYTIFRSFLRNRITYLKDKFYLITISKVNGFYQTLSEIYRSAPFDTKQDYDNYMSRLKSVPTFVEGHQKLLETALELGYIQPKPAVDGVAKLIRDMVYEDITKSPYYQPFVKIPEAIMNEDERKSLEENGAKIIQESVFPPLLKFAEFFENEYFPRARDDLAAINLPNGIEFYNDCIKYHTTLDITAEQVHEKGLNEVKRIREEMTQVIKSANFDGSISEFIEYLRTSPEFYVKTPEELLEKVSRICKKIDGQLPKLFKTLPRLPYGIEPIPDYSAPGNYTAYYNYGTGDGTRSGTYFVNTYDLKSRGLYEYDALSLHESVPGHHLQLAIQQENEVPDFRKYENINSFIEGWALYTETLGFDCGLYQTPYTNFGRLSFEMWRACRLVVDTGIHAMGWSRDDAINFMLENTALSKLNIENEVDRYISWPGQALAYKLGEIKIRELRKKAEIALKDKFDIREFHDAVLRNGSIPLEVLEIEINQWIEMQQESHTK